jgi:hypothetical protein
MAKVLNVLKASLQDAEVEIDRLEGELARFREIKKGLEYAIDREQRPKVKSVSNGGTGDWSISRTLAVERVLREVGAPLSPVQISQELANRGRDDPAAGVSAALSRLKSDGRVVQVSFGQWTLPSLNGAEGRAEEPLDA